MPSTEPLKPSYLLGRRGTGDRETDVSRALPRPITCCRYPACDHSPCRYLVELVVALIGGLLTCAPSLGRAQGQSRASRSPPSRLPSGSPRRSPHLVPTPPMAARRGDGCGGGGGDGQGGAEGCAEAATAVHAERCRARPRSHACMPAASPPPPSRIAVALCGRCGGGGWEEGLMRIEPAGGPGGAHAAVQLLGGGSARRRAAKRLCCADGLHECRPSRVSSRAT